MWQQKILILAQRPFSGKTYNGYYGLYQREISCSFAAVSESL